VYLVVFTWVCTLVCAWVGFDLVCARVCFALLLVVEVVLDRGYDSHRELHVSNIVSGHISYRVSSHHISSYANLRLQIFVSHLFGYTNLRFVIFRRRNMGRRLRRMRYTCTYMYVEECDTKIWEYEDLHRCSTKKCDTRICLDIECEYLRTKKFDTKKCEAKSGPRIVKYWISRPKRRDAKRCPCGICHGLCAVVNNIWISGSTDLQILTFGSVQFHRSGGSFRFQVET